VSKLFRFLHHIYFDQEKDSNVTVQVAGKLSERTVRIIQRRCAWRN